MSKTSESVRLFKALMVGCDLGAMRLADLDRLSSSVKSVCSAGVVGFDLFELREFGKEVDRVLEVRRLLRSGVTPGQLCFDGELFTVAGS